MPSASRISLVALDVDGTTLDPDHVILPRVIEAIRRVRDAGAEVAFATARSPAALRTVIQQLGEPETAICFNGAWVGRVDLDPGRSTALAPGEPLQLDLARHAVTAACAIGLDVAWYAPEHVSIFAMGPLWEREFRITGEPFALVEGNQGDAPPLKLLIAATRDDQIPALQSVSLELGERASVAFSHPRFLEVMRPGVTKATGLERLCAKLGLDLANVAAMGDSGNDVAMLREAGIGIAMGNAMTEAKEAADWVTTHNTEAGVAAAIDRLFAEELIAPLASVRRASVPA